MTDFTWRDDIIYHIANKKYPKIKDPFHDIVDDKGNSIDRKMPKEELDFFNRQDLILKLRNIIYITEFIIKRIFYISIGFIIGYMVFK